MLSNDPSATNHAGAKAGGEPLGFIVSIGGSQASAQLRWRCLPDNDDVGGTTVGKLLIIRGKHSRTIGVITKISAEARPIDGPKADHTIGQLDLLGEIKQDAGGAEYFQRGVTE